MGLFFARNEAKRIWEKYVNADEKTDLEKIARSEGIRIFKDELDDGISGILIVKRDNPFVFVNVRDAQPRQRFTIAHEIGHYLLHRPDGIHIDKGFSVAFRNLKSSSGEEKQEIEANQFAAELLMPASLVEQKIPNKLSITDQDIESLAKFFDVSLQAMTIRLTSLGCL